MGFIGRKSLVKSGVKTNEVLSFDTNFQGTFAPTISDIDNNITPIWKDSLGNEIEADTPNFSYGDTSLKSVYVYFPEGSNPSVEIDFGSPSGNNYYVNGPFDLSNLKLSGQILLYNNAFTNLVFGQSDNLISLLYFGSNDNYSNTFSLDLSPLKNVEEYRIGPFNGEKLKFTPNPISTKVKFDFSATPWGNSGNGKPNLNELVNFISFSNKLTGFNWHGQAPGGLSTIDLRNFIEVEGHIDIRNNGFSNVHLPTVNQDSGDFDNYVVNENVTELDFSYVKQGGIAHQGCNSLQTVTYPISSGSLRTFNLHNCDLQPSIDVSGVKHITEDFETKDNPNLESITLMAAGESDNVTSVNVSGCNLQTQDMKIGTVFKQGSFNLRNNSMDQATVDLNIDNCYQNEANITSTKFLNIGGTNAEPSGTYQDPGGTPTSAKEQIWELVNTYGWTVTYSTSSGDVTKQL